MCCDTWVNVKNECDPATSHHAQDPLLTVSRSKRYEGYFEVFTFHTYHNHVAKSITFRSGFVVTLTYLSEFGVVGLIMPIVCHLCYSHVLS